MTQNKHGLVQLNYKAGIILYDPDYLSHIGPFPQDKEIR